MQRPSLHVLAMRCGVQQSGRSEHDTQQQGESSAKRAGCSQDMLLQDATMSLCHPCARVMRVTFRPWDLLWRRKHDVLTLRASAARLSHLPCTLVLQRTHTANCLASSGGACWWHTPHLSCTSGMMSRSMPAGLPGSDFTSTPSGLPSCMAAAAVLLLLGQGLEESCQQHLETCCLLLSLFVVLNTCMCLRCKTELEGYTVVAHSTC